jgi:hypothetical protein
VFLNFDFHIDYDGRNKEMPSKKLNLEFKYPNSRMLGIATMP